MSRARSIHSPASLEREQQHRRNEEDQQRRVGGGSRSIQAANRAFSLFQAIRSTSQGGDQRAQMLPQPRLEQEDEGEEDEERRGGRGA